jgi:hypothetical protein
LDEIKPGTALVIYYFLSIRLSLRHCSGLKAKSEPALNIIEGTCFLYLWHKLSNCDFLKGFGGAVPGTPYGEPPPYMNYISLWPLCALWQNY